MFGEIFANKRLMKENIRLRCRVAELEERLCPCEQHDWVKVEVTYDYDGYSHCSVRSRFKCKRCGKEMED